MAAKQFDVTLKDLIEEYAAIWPMLAGPWPARSVDVIDADIATLTGAADKVLLVHGATGDWIMNLELQAGHRLNLPDRMHLNSTALYHRHHILVRSVVVLLRRKALASNLTGVLELRLADEEEPYNVFRYRVVRVWELPVETLLTGSLGLLPLAPLTDQAAGQLPLVLGRIEDRLRQEVTPEEAQKLLQRLGRKRFGPPDPATIAAIESLTDLDRLEQLRTLGPNPGYQPEAPARDAGDRSRAGASGWYLQTGSRCCPVTLSERVLEVSSWQELFR